MMTSIVPQSSLGSAGRDSETQWWRSCLYDCEAWRKQELNGKTKC